MTLSEIVILGSMQGLTEFLPVSSSGHLVVARLLFDIPEVEGTAVDAFLHLGTLLAVLVYYWRVWRELILNLGGRGEQDQAKKRLLFNLMIATVPAAVIGWWWREHIEVGRSKGAIAAGFLVTAAVLYWAENLGSRGRQLEPKQEKREPTARDAFIIGLAQAVALVPSISRSGVTIAAGMARGLKREQAITFSFLMSAPIIAGAGLVSLSSLASSGLSGIEMTLGVAASFASGWLAINWLMKMIKRISLLPFVVYLVILAVGLLYVS